MDAAAASPRSRRPARFTKREIAMALAAAKAAGWATVEFVAGELRVVFSEGAPVASLPERNDWDD